MGFFNFGKKKEVNSEKNNEAETLNSNGNIEFKNGNYKEAVDYFTRALNISPIAKYYHNRADSYNMDGQFENAILDFNKVISLEPSLNNRGVYSKLAGIYLDEKNGI